MKIPLLYQVSHYIRVKRQRNINSWDQQNHLVIRGFYVISDLFITRFHCNKLQTCMLNTSLAKPDVSVTSTNYNMYCHIVTVFIQTGQYVHVCILPLLANIHFNFLPVYLQIS